MKITDLEKSPSGVKGMSAKDGRKQTEGTEADFRSLMVKAESNSYEQHLEGLVDEIIKQGEKLTRKIDVREFRDYKRLISEFLDTAMGKSLKFSKQIGRASCRERV